MLISNMNEYDTVPFQDILIAKKRNIQFMIKLKHGLTKSNFFTKYINIPDLKSWNSK